MEIKNIIFDMGNVIFTFDPKEIIAALDLNLSAEDSACLLREVFRCSEWVSMDHGLMTLEEGWQRMCTRLPAHLHQAARSCVFDWWKKPRDPVPGMAELIREVKALGYGVYLLSNATSALHQYFQTYPGAEYFDGFVVSADVKLLKPQREIYEVLFHNFSLRPEECFFIDDNAANIDGAWAVGMPGAVFFGDMLRLRRELRSAGVPVSLPSAE